MNVFESMEKVRVDKWLWSVRVFKTRTQATDACKSGHVRIGSDPAKPASILTGNEILQVKKAGFNLTFKVLKLIEKRVSAVLASECYEDLTPPAELSKYEDWFAGKKGVEFRERGTGRPTKRERRNLDQFKDDRYK